MSIPLSDYIADSFSDTHTGYSLNRLNYATVGNLRATPCSLILAIIYLERMKDADPAYTKHVTPTELFLVSMVSDRFRSSSLNAALYMTTTKSSPFLCAHFYRLPLFAHFADGRHEILQRTRR